MDKKTAVIVGVGTGLSASFARLLARQGYHVVLAARRAEKLADLVAETKAEAHALDGSDAGAVAALFDGIGKAHGAPEIVVYNPSARVRGPVTDLDPAEVEKALRVTAFGAFLVGQQAARLMLPQGRGTIFFTGATAGVKGFPNSSSFAMGKFALRGLAQSMARELAPKGIHICHVVIDGGIQRGPEPNAEDRRLEPDAIAETYWHLHTQHRSAWTWEIEVRPWMENW